MNEGLLLNPRSGITKVEMIVLFNFEGPIVHAKQVHWKFSFAKLQFLFRRVKKRAVKIEEKRAFRRKQNGQNNRRGMLYVQLNMGV